MNNQIFQTQGDKLAYINEHPTAYRVLDLMAEAAVLCLAPPARGIAVARTIEEISSLFTIGEDGSGPQEIPLTVVDLIHGLIVVHSHYAAVALTYEPAEVAARLTGQTAADIESARARAFSRAATLREIGEHLSALAGVGAPTEDWNTSRRRCLAVWSRVADRFPGDDARALAIRDTWGREAGYLAD